MSEYPLISCVMPTRNRRAFLAHAVKLFLAQDYPNKELVTLEDGEECNWDVMAGTNYHHLGNAQHTIGYKRNFAMWSHIVRGDIITHWDDDDYYGEERLSRQVQPILNGVADVTALKMSLLFRTQDMTLWHCSDEVHRVLFCFDVRGSTLMYKASYWHEGLTYTDCSQGEDVAYLHGLIGRGARLEHIADPSSYICVRHGDNVTDDIDGIDMSGWEQVEIERYLSSEEQAFYASIGGSNVHGSR